jgi:hypothetical protein
MRALFLATAALLTLSAFADPRPRTAVTIRRDQAAALVWVKWTLTAAGNPDQTGVTVTATGQTAVTRTYGVSSKTDSVSFPAPAPAASISGTVTPRSVRRGLTTTGSAAPWSYTEPDVPPPAPTVTVEVRPAAFSVEPGGSATLTVRVSPL